MSRYDLVVVGAGILGLAVAREWLARHDGAHILVVEAELPPTSVRHDLVDRVERYPQFLPWCGGAQVLGSDPIAQAIMLGSGYDPSKFGQMGLMGAATEFGAADPRTQNWQVGTGQSYDNTAAAVNAKLAETARSNDMESADRRYGTDQTVAENRRQFDVKPMPALSPQGQPVFAQQNALEPGGYAPIISETDQKGTLLGQNFDNLPALNPQQQEVLGARADGNKAGTPKKAEPLKVAFAYVGPVGDGGWTFAHDNGRKAVEKEFGDKVVTTFVEKVPESADAERVFRVWADVIQRRRRLEMARPARARPMGLAVKNPLPPTMSTMRRVRRLRASAAVEKLAPTAPQGGQGAAASSTGCLSTTRWCAAPTRCGTARCAPPWR